MTSLTEDQARAVAHAEQAEAILALIPPEWNALHGAYAAAATHATLAHAYALLALVEGTTP